MKTPDAEGKGQGRRKGSEPGTGWNSVQIITKGKERGGRFMYKKENRAVYRGAQAGDVR